MLWSSYEQYSAVISALYVGRHAGNTVISPTRGCSQTQSSLGIYCEFLPACSALQDTSRTARRSRQAPPFKPSIQVSWYPSMRLGLCPVSRLSSSQVLDQWPSSLGMTVMPPRDNLSQLATSSRSSNTPNTKSRGSEPRTRGQNPEISPSYMNCASCS